MRASRAAATPLSCILVLGRKPGGGRGKATDILQGMDMLHLWAPKRGISFPVSCLFVRERPSTDKMKCPAQSCQNHDITSQR
jgi:hypothetical protein